MSHRLTRITIRPIAGSRAAGLKGMTFSDGLEGVDVFVGPNGSGKTTRLLALLGAIQGLASTTTDRQRPCLGAAPQGVEVEIDTTGGSWTRDLGVTNPSTTAHRTATREAHRLVGEPIVSWDLADWSSGTDGGRRAILSRLAQIGDIVEAWSARDAQIRLRERLDGVDGAPDVVDLLVDAHPTAEDAALWLEAASSWSTAAATEARADLRTAEGILEGRRDEMPARPEHDPAQVTADLAAQRDRLATLQQAGAEIDRHAARIAQAERDLADVTDRGQALRALSPLVAPTTEPVTRAEADLTAAQAALTAPIPALAAPPPVDPALAVAVEQAEKRLTAAREAKDAAAAASTAASSALSDAQQAHDLRRQVDERTAALRLQAQMPCRHCGQPDPLGVLDDVEQSSDPLPDLADLAAACAAATAAHQRATGALLDADVARAAARQALARAEGAAQSALADGQRREARIRAERQEAVTGSRTRLEQAWARHAQAVREHQAETDRRTSALTRMRAEYVAAEQHLRALRSATVEAVDEKALAAVHARIADLQWQADEIRAHAQAVEALRLAAEAVTAAETHRAACAALVEGVRAVQLEQAAACYGPVEEAARALLEGAWDGAPQPYLAGPADYGAVVRGRRTRYEALSESERRVTAAALVYALAVVAAQPCRLVLLDGLEVVQADHRAPLLAALVRAHQAGLVDSVLITCATSLDPDRAAVELADLTLPGVRIHRLEIA